MKGQKALRNAVVCSRNGQRTLTTHMTVSVFSSSWRDHCPFFSLSLSLSFSSVHILNSTSIYSFHFSFFSFSLLSQSKINNPLPPDTDPVLLTDMLNFPGCLAGNGADMSVLERQQLRLSFNLLHHNHQFQPKSCDFSATHNLSGFPVLATDFHLGHEDGNELGCSPQMPTSSLEMDHSAVPRTMPIMKEEAGLAADEIGEEPGLIKMMECTMAGSSFKKRKAESATAEESRCKRRNRGNAEDEDHSPQTPNENSNKIPDVQNQKQDYVHVRARRGQATDSHSLAERARREKINKKMKSLQELVPGCNKTTGKAGMLDEIINYVQSLQRQVEFLSMKLAHVNPGLELNMDNIFTKEFPACVAATLSEMTNLAYNEPNSVQPVATSCEQDMLTPMYHPLQTAQPRVSSSPASQVQSFLTWETDLQNLYQAGFQ